MDAAAIIVAGGSSRRMGFDKLTAPLCGKPVLAHSVAALVACEAVGHIVLVAHPDRIDQLREIAEAAAAGHTPLTTVPGGSERQDSVQAGVAAAPARFTLLAVHDGARPLVPPEAIARALDSARAHGAAALSHPVTDTLKRALPDGTAGEPVDRTRLHALETPQCFQRALLEAAFAHVREHGLTVTDEVSALQAAGQPAVHLIDTRAPNPKITFPTDIPFAEALLRAR